MQQPPPTPTQSLLEDFLGGALDRLATARAARQITRNYLVAPDDRKGALAVEARAHVLGCPLYLRGLAAPLPRRTRATFEAHLVELRTVEAHLEGIARATREDREARLPLVWVMAAYRAFPADRDGVTRALADAPEVWRTLADAWRMLRAVWARVLDALPDLDEALARLALLDAPAFWGAFWRWMLHAHPQGAPHTAEAVVEEVGAYLATVGAAAIVAGGEYGGVACRAALGAEIAALPDSEDWSALHTDRMHAALLATGTAIDVPPLSDGWRARTRREE